MVLIRLADGKLQNYDLVETTRGLRVQNGVSYLDLLKMMVDVGWCIVSADGEDQVLLLRHGVPFATSGPLGSL